MTEQSGHKGPASQPEAGLLQRAQQFALRLHGQKQDSRLLLRNYAFSAALLEQVLAVADANRSAERDRRDAALAACFLTTGYPFDYDQPAPYSVKAAQQFLQQQNLPEAEQRRVLTAIQRILRSEIPANEPERLLNDARVATLYLHNSEEKLALMRLEQELMQQREFTKAEWARYLLQQLMAARLYTHHGQAVWQPQLAQAIHQQRQEADKRLEKEEAQAGRYAHLEKKEPVRGAQTYFRTNYRNHINLSAIADNKANIMISVNAILVSVLITFLSYRNIGENSPQILLPVIIFIVTGLTSLIFAVLSARPKVTRLNREGSPADEIKDNLIFFGNFVSLPIDQFEDAMEEVLQDSSLLYGNMVRDLYHLGKVLDKKYRYLAISYNVFMVGFAATVISFLAALFL